MKAIIKRARGGEVPEVSALKRVLQIVLQCKTAAFELAHYLQHTSFAIFVSWTARARTLPNNKNVEICRTVFKILCALLNVANSDYKGIKVDKNAEAFLSLEDSPKSRKEINQSLIFASGNINFGVSPKNKIGARSNSVEIELVKIDGEAIQESFMQTFI